MNQKNLNKDHHKGIRDALRSIRVEKRQSGIDYRLSDKLGFWLDVKTRKGAAIEDALNEIEEEVKEFLKSMRKLNAV